MFYRFSKTSSKVNIFVPFFSCFCALLMDWNNSLFDIICKVSFIFCQSARLKTTDFVLPSGVVINSILWSSIVCAIMNSLSFLRIINILSSVNGKGFYT